MWRAKYDMPPDEFRTRNGPAMGQVKAALFITYTFQAAAREIWRLGGAPTAIPLNCSHNVGAGWETIYPLLAPPNADPGYDLSAI